MDNLGNQGTENGEENDDLGNGVVKSAGKLLNRNFALMLQGGIVSLFGTVLYSIAIGYYVYSTTGSEALMGVFSSIAMFMTMFLSPISGAIIDRSDRKKIIVGMDFATGVLMLIIGYLCLNDYLNIPNLTIFTVVIAIMSVFYRPSISTILIDIVPKNELVRATSIVSSTQSVVQLVGQGISGFLLIHFGIGELILFNGISYLFSAVTECFINIPKTPNQGTGINIANIKRDLVVGFKTMVTKKGLRIIFFFAIIINICSSGIFTLYLIFATEKGFTLAQYGLLLSMISIGALIGAGVVSIVKFTPQQRYKYMCLGFVFSLMFSALGYISTNFYLIASAHAIANGLSAMANMFMSASLMLLMPQETRAACLGFLSSSSMGGMAISTLLYGLLAEIFPIASIGIVGVLICAIPMIVFVKNKEIKSAVIGISK